MHHNARVRQSVALALGAAGKQELTHGGSQAHAVRGNIARRVLHGVINSHARSDRATRGVDVERNVASGVLGGQQEDLGAQLVRNLIIDLGSQEDNALAQQALVHAIAQIHTRRRRVH